MPASFYIFLIVCFISFIPVFGDHGEAWKAFKGTTGLKKTWNGVKVLSIWSVPLFSLIGTLFLGFESWQDSKKDEEHEKQYKDVTNHLAQANAKLKRIGPRHLNDEEQKRLVAALIPIQKVKVAFNIPPDVADALSLAEQLAHILSQNGFTIIPGDSLEKSGIPENNGLMVDIKGDPNSPIAAQIIAAFNSVGLNAHPPGPPPAILIGVGSANQIIGVLYIDIGLNSSLISTP